MNLLKDEKDEKSERLLIFLERKSMRLKVLIEDLFEDRKSKAFRRNVKLNLMNVDIVNLF